MLRGILLGLLVSAVLGASLLYYYRDQTSHAKSLFAAEKTHAVQLAIQSVHHELETVIGDLRFLSDHNELRDYLLIRPE